AINGSPGAFNEHLVHQMAGMGLHPESGLAAAPSVRLPDDTTLFGKILDALVNQVLELGTHVRQHLGCSNGAIGLAQHLRSPLMNASNILQRPVGSTPRWACTLLPPRRGAGLP